MKRLWLALATAAGLTACVPAVRYHSKPIVPATTANRLQRGTLDSPGLRQFMEENAVQKINAWPLRAWGLNDLTLAAYYYNPQMQIARARAEAARAAVTTAAARLRLRLQRGGIRQSWGGVVAEWVASGAPALGRVLNQRDVLLEVTIPAGRKSLRPPSVRLEIPAGNSVTANLVSAFPRVDPRIQGVSLLYLSPARPGLVPGVNPVARFAVGRLKSGVVVPESAVVWWQGNAWAYQQTKPGHYVRRQVETGTPVRSGYFVTDGLAAGDKVVVEGAQMVLSTELAPQRESAGGEDTD